MKHCPNSYESGCRCPEHAAGLLQHATDVHAFLIALHQADRDRSRRLAVVPVPETPRMPHGDLKDHQPWVPRAPRHLKRAA